MQWGLGVLLSAIGIFLVGGLIAMIGAAASEAKLDPGQVRLQKSTVARPKATIIGAVLVIASRYRLQLLVEF